MLIGISLFFMYALLLVLGVIALPALVGQATLKVFNQAANEISLTTLLVGVVGVVLLSVLPIIGSFILVGVLVLAIGGMIDLFVQSLQK